MNTAIVISDSVLEKGIGIKSPTGKFNVVIAIYDDSKKYSGTDFGIAVASDITGYFAGNMAAGALGGVTAAETANNNPILVVYGTYVGVNTLGGIFGDSFSKVLKENLADTDTQKGIR
ncbi:hypothetical protein [uncultured Phascolarctobacterium sp.]|uniref:hypothetical protein n=1 Tax=uncultured Phascolarctobacterium sp. TaxID=512296 RepID=UPI002625A948|nr:hypothetical protein [uncultured Phascolarctobacterium sp.]